MILRQNIHLYNNEFKNYIKPMLHVDRLHWKKIGVSIERKRERERERKKENVNLSFESLQLLSYSSSYLFRSESETDCLVVAKDCCK
jgi:hypothetical protein